MQRTKLSRPLTFVVILALAGALPAQIKRVIPGSVATQDGNRSSPFFAAYAAGRVQLIIERSELCQTLAMINQVALRADAAVIVPKKTISSVKFTMGYAKTTPSGMNLNFAANRSGTQRVMFNGRLDLPAQVAASHPFNIVWKFTKPFQFLSKNGDLLLEWSIPLIFSVGSYHLDTHQQTAPTGYAHPFGKNGSFAAPELYGMSCPSPNKLKVGGSLDLRAGSFRNKYPSFVAVGFSRQQFGPLPLPLDLSSVGAKGNALYVSLDVFFPLAMTGTPGRWEVKSSAPIPTDTNLKGLWVYAQTVFLDAKANPFGLVFSEGLSLRLANKALVSSHTAHYDDTAPGGHVVYAGTGHVVEFGGVFQ